MKKVWRKENETCFRLREVEQNWQRTYNVTLGRVRATVVTVVKQSVLHMVSVCVCVCVASDTIGNQTRDIPSLTNLRIGFVNTCRLFKQYNCEL